MKSAKHGLLKKDILSQIKLGDHHGPVCSNLREVWAKRRNEAHFVSKLTDVDGENSETDTWLDFAKDCGYLEGKHYEPLKEKCRSVGKMLGSMLKNPESFILRL